MSADAFGVVVTKTAAAQREGKLRGELIGELHSSQTLDTATTARARGLGIAAITDEQQFGIDVELEQRQRPMPVLIAPLRADIHAVRGHQKIGAFQRRFAIIGINARQNAARIIAVKTASGIEEKLGTSTRINETRARAQQRIAG